MNPAKNYRPFVRAIWDLMDGMDQITENMESFLPDMDHMAYELMPQMLEVMPPMGHFNLPLDAQRIHRFADVMRGDDLFDSAALGIDHTNLSRIAVSDMADRIRHVRA